jgi:TolB protein
MPTSAPPRPQESSEPVDWAELEDFVEALIEEARQRQRRRRRRYGALAAVAAIGGLSALNLLGRAASSQSTLAEASAPSTVGTAATSSSRIAFIGESLNRGGYTGSIFVMNADGRARRELAPGFPGMRWSPDGTKIAYTDWRNPTSALYVMNADGTGATQLTAGRGVSDSAPEWSPDGHAIAFLRQDHRSRVSVGIYRVNADGREERRLTRYGVGQLAWSRDGRKVVFVTGRDGDFELFVVNADGTGEHRLTRNDVRDNEPVWSPDGRKIAYVSDSQLNVMNANGTGQRRLTFNGGRIVAPSWSPDGRRIVFERRLGWQDDADRYTCTGCGQALVFEVWVINADGSAPRRLTKKGGDNSAPAWSPDRRKIAFVSERDGNAEIYLMNPDGSGQRNLTRTRGWSEHSLTWSPAKP